MNTKIEKTRVRIRYVLLFFMVALVISGLTAVPIEPELYWAIKFFPPDSAIASLLYNVLIAVGETRDKFPFLFYGYDWLAFAHIMIATAFIGPYREPVKNIWVIEFGMIACVSVLPFALVVGGLRGLPVWWRLIDCSFGVFGFLPLWYCHKQIRKLEALTGAERLNTIF